MRVHEAWSRIPTVSLKFALILTPALLGAAVLFQVLVTTQREEQLVAAQEARMKAMADGAVQVLADVPPQALPAVVRALAAPSGLLCAAIVGEGGGGIAAWPDPCPEPSAEVRTLHRPLTLRGGSGAGRAELVFTYAADEARALLEEESEIGTTVQLAFILFTLGLALLAHRLTLAVPLGRMILAIRQAEQRRSRDLVNWQSGDELGQLTAVYNRLLARLASEEAAARESAQRLALAISATRSAVWDIDLRSGNIWWSPELPALLGYDSDELPMTTNTFEALVHPDDLPPALGAWLRHIGGESGGCEGLLRLRGKDGTWRWMESKANSVCNREGVAWRLVGIMFDVSRRRQVEDDLARERSLLQATLENVDQGIIMFDQDQKVVTFNRRVADMLNVPLKLLTQRPTHQDILACQQERGEIALVAHADADSGSSTPPPPPWEMLPQDYCTVRHSRPDGTILEVRANPLFGGGVVCTYSDVTAEARAAGRLVEAVQAMELAYEELKRTQAELIEAGKMASLGILVAGIAHEINTPVGIAFSCASHLAHRTRELNEALVAGTLKKSELLAYGEAAAEASRLMSANLSRAAELIRSFKHVAVDQASAVRRRFDLRVYIQEVVTSLGPRLKEMEHPVALACPEGLTVNTFPGELSQVLTNLVINALVHAFPDRRDGRITITAAAPDGGERAGEGSEDVVITVADDGRGVPASHRERIFEPFFTTRRGSGGSGLGLHIVYNIVTRSLGGTITVDSTEGAGTAFRIRIPREAPGVAGEAESGDGYPPADEAQPA